MNNSTIKRSISISASLIFAIMLMCAITFFSVGVSAQEDGADKAMLAGEMKNEISAEDNNAASSNELPQADRVEPTYLSDGASEIGDGNQKSSDDFTGVRDGRYYVDGSVKTADKPYLVAFENYIYTVDENGNAEKYIKNADKKGSYQLTVEKSCYSVSYKTGKILSEFTGVFDGIYYENGSIKTSDKSQLTTYNGKLYEVSENGSAALFSGVCSQNDFDLPSAMTYYSVGAGNSGNPVVYVSGYICKKGNRSAGLYQPVDGEKYAVTDDGTSPLPKVVSSSAYCKDGVRAVSSSESNVVYDGRVFRVSASGTASVYRNGAGTVETQQGLYTVDAAGTAVELFTGVYNGKYYSQGKVATAEKPYFITYADKVYKVSVSGTAALFTGTYNDEYYENGVRFTGWREIDGKRCYYDENGMVTGWKKISNTYYFFAGDGALETSKITGNADGGYWYVDNNGARITDATVKQAVDLVTEHGGTGTGEEKLKACYDYMYQNFPYKRDYGIPDETNMAQKASMLFTEKKGNCFCFASAYAYVAKVLGYDSRATTGMVAAAGGGTTPHGWTKIKIDTTWYVFDVELQTQSKTNFFKRTGHPWHATEEFVYELVIKDGKVNWVKV